MRKLLGTSRFHLPVSYYFFAVVFVLTVLFIKYYNILQSLQFLPDWVFVIILLLIISYYVSKDINTRRTQRKREKLLNTLAELSSLVKLPKLLLESEENLTKSAEELTCQKFFEQLKKYDYDNYDKRIFVRFLLPNFTYCPHEIEMDEGFYEEIENHFCRANILKPVVFREPRLFGSLEVKIPSLADFVQHETHESKFDKLDRVNAQHEFKGDFCLVLPMLIHSALPDELLKQDKQRIFGYIGIVEHEYIKDSMANDFAMFLHRFQETYSHIKEEKLTLHIDRLLNESQYNRLTPSPKQTIPELFATRFSAILKQEFHAERVELWLKGMEPRISDSIFELVNGILQGQHPISLEDRNIRSSYDYSLDQGIELDKCYLGLMRILRNQFDFSEIERELLKKVERDIDNYVRDLWEEHIFREIDHKVFNLALPTLKEFAKRLIQEIVIEFDAFCGLFEIQDRDDVFYTLPYYDRDKGIDTLNTLKSEHQKNFDPTINIKNRIHYLFVPLSLNQEERLGAIYLLGKGHLSDVHRYALKRFEALLDNILKLYLVLEKLPPA